MPSTPFLMSDKDSLISTCHQLSFFHYVILDQSDIPCRSVGVHLPTLTAWILLGTRPQTPQPMTAICLPCANLSELASVRPVPSSSDCKSIALEINPALHSRGSMVQASDSYASCPYIKTNTPGVIAGMPASTSAPLHALAISSRDPARELWSTRSRPLVPRFLSNPRSSRSKS